jgi:hypothetical protein
MVFGTLSRDLRPWRLTTAAPRLLHMAPEEPTKHTHILRVIAICHLECKSYNGNKSILTIGRGRLGSRHTEGSIVRAGPSCPFRSVSKH